MNVPNSKFCVLPWISLEASPIGTVRPCCLAADEIVNSHGVKFNLDTADFDSVRNSEYMYQLRQAFLAGEKPATCRRCWAEESAGRTSKRMHTLTRLKNLNVGDQWTHDAKPLMFLDLKLGNICNLKCRICGPWSSSQCATEELADIPPAEKKQSFAYQMLQRGSWPRENEKFWAEIDQCLHDIRYIEFTGGEPFLISQHFEMLQHIVDRGIAHQVEIHYNTNGTVYPDAAENIWRHFRTVRVAFSIDDTGQRFEYQRSNAEWNQVCANITRFQQLKKTMPNLQLQCCTTVNVFNVRYLDAVANWIATQHFDFVYWNMLHDAWHFSIACLPDRAKNGIQRWLKSAPVPPQYFDEFENIIEFMNRGESTSGEVLRMEIAKLDQRRNQNLRAVAKELADLIDYEKPA